MEKLSIIVCSYNPKEIFFERCLTAITVASRSYLPTEVIIVDNNSTPGLSLQPYVQSFLALNDNARIVVETKQGLTPARLRGIRESSGDILVFIDDDNIIENDFLLRGVGIATSHPHIGSWSGSVSLEFEQEPGEWTKPYWGMLVNREISENRWSNLPHLSETMPCGAGLFIRKEVADHYFQLHATGKRNIQLDRSGNSLFSGGDNDLAACACDIGLGMGVFGEIRVRHYIPSYRTQKKYLLELTEGIAASSVVFHSLRGQIPPPITIKKRIANTLRLILKPKLPRQFFAAALRGEKKGRRMLNSDPL